VQKKGKKKKHMLRAAVYSICFFFLFYHLPQNVDIFAIDNVAEATRLPEKKRKIFFVS
jgi:hypothetical protein